jgi:4-amino-4-deoxy-L-arabinose transferase-like glycosyltransferase
MNPASDLPPRFLGLSPAAATIAVIAVTTLFRFFYCTWLPILPDEAYYFQWSRHLDASYFSKGPAVAYTIFAGTALWGGNNLGIRFFAVMLSAGTAWQMFLLARRWYDETVGLIAVLITNVVPLYALGAVVMTIDPLSAFFWIWAANLFSQAIQKDHMIDWLLVGFAVGSGFLAKYLNALELVAFLAFLLLVPERRRLLLQPGFWLMLLVALLCTTPVFWWNWQHGWVSAGQLATRGKLNEPFALHYSTFLDFLILQAVVISPLIFLALLVTAIRVSAEQLNKRISRENEGELLLLVLFLPVFLMYALLSWHFRGEPNWPAISYLTLIILMAARWRQLLAAHSRQGFIATAFLLAWVQSTLMHDTGPFHLPRRLDPMGRLAGWSAIAAHLSDLQKEKQADVVIADGYKEASIFSFHRPDQAFIYALRHSPPANQFDFWPGYPTAPPHRALWITSGTSSSALQHDFNTITFVERVIISFHDKPLREYTVYLCENKDRL